MRLSQATVCSCSLFGSSAHPSGQKTATLRVIYQLSMNSFMVRCAVLLLVVDCLLPHTRKLICGRVFPLRVTYRSIIPDNIVQVETSFLHPCNRFFFGYFPLF